MEFGTKPDHAGKLDAKAKKAKSSTKSRKKELPDFPCLPPELQCIIPH